jgi:hypothetical protein
MPALPINAPATGEALAESIVDSVARNTDLTPLFL